MNSFSLKDSLLMLKNKNYDDTINHNIDILVNTYDEYQLLVLAGDKGLKINNIIRLFYMDNVGFRCLNEKSDIYGKLPICKNIEKYMNSLYLDSFDD